MLQGVTCARVATLSDIIKTKLAIATYSQNIRKVIVSPRVRSPFAGAIIQPLLAGLNGQLSARRMTARTRNAEPLHRP